MALELKRGKFYRDGVPVPLEFGNKEQIDLMTKELGRISAMEDGLQVELEITTKYLGAIKFKCKCGACTVYFEEESDNDDDFDFEGHNSSCFKCNTVYEIGKDGDGEYIAFVVKEGAI